MSIVEGVAKEEHKTLHAWKESYNSSILFKVSGNVIIIIIISSEVESNISQ